MPLAEATSARHYWCFISYRHNDNKQEGRQWATWLHQAIETYEVPADLVGTRNELGEEIPARIFPVFRDEEELPADADLSRPILRALHNSRYLVALCSPGAVASRFVTDEITRFKAMGKPDRIIAAIIAGEPNASASTDPALAGQECFPVPLRYEVEADGTLSDRPAEPIAADFRLEDGSQGWTSPEAYRVALKKAGRKSAEIDRLVHRYEKRLSLMTLKIIAGILGVDLGVLTKRDKAYQLELARRRAVVVNRWLALAGLLAIVATIAAITSFLNAQEAKTQRKVVETQRQEVEVKRQEAELQKAEAIAQRDQARYNEGLGWLLRAEVAEERGKRYPETLLYAAQAIGFEGFGRPKDAGESPMRYIRKDRDPEAFERAQKWIADRPAYRPIWASELRSSPATALAVRPTGRWLAVAHEDGLVTQWDLASGESSPVVPHDATGATDLAFHPSEQSLALGLKFRIQLWELAKKEIAADRTGGNGTVAWSPYGDLLVSGGPPGNVLLWRGDIATPLATGLSVVPTRLAFSPENSIFAALFPGQGVRLFYPASVAPAFAWQEHRGDVSALAIRPDGQQIAIGTTDGAVSLWSAADAKQTGVTAPNLRHAGAVLDLDYHPAGHTVASASDDGTVKLWDLRSPEPSLIVTLAGHSGAVHRVRYLPGGDTLASAGADGSARLWIVSGEKEAAPDWFTYLDRGLLGFDPATQEPRWTGGGGFVGVPAGSLLHAWQRGSAPAVAEYFQTHGAWVAAAQMGADAAAIRTSLLADAADAADEGRWHRADLRLRQIGALGGSMLDEQIKKLTDVRAAALAREGQSFTNGEGQTMIWCPPTGPDGFLMGSPDSEDLRFDYETQHKVILSTGFWISQYETTQSEWVSIMKSNPSSNTQSGLRAPVETISWNEAVDYCRILTDLERSRGIIPQNWRYDLPSEAQWEYACRAGTTTAYGFGDNAGLLHQYGNFLDKSASFDSSADLTQDDGAVHTAPVGKYRPNLWGMYDMHGNVIEWCRDGIDSENPDYLTTKIADPIGTGALKALRGGGFLEPVGANRSAYRGAYQPALRNGNTGFRVALVYIGQP